MLKRTRFAFRDYGHCIGKTVIALVEAAPEKFWIRYASNNGSGEFTIFMAYPTEDARWKIQRGHYAVPGEPKIVDDLVAFIGEHQQRRARYLYNADKPIGTLILTTQA